MISLPNYNLVKYEIDNLNKNDDNAIYYFYKNIAFKHKDRLGDLYDWFKTFGDLKLSGIRVVNLPSFGYDIINNDRTFMFVQFSGNKRAIVYAESCNGIRRYFSSWNL